MDNLPFIFLSVSIYHILQKRIGQFSGRISQSSTHLFAVQPVFPEFHMCTCTIIYINYEGVRIYQGIWIIKRSEMRPLGGATFCVNHLPAVTTILTPILVCLKPKILPIRRCHFQRQSPACVHCCKILYVGKSRFSCKRFSPFVTISSDVQLSPDWLPLSDTITCRRLPRYSPLF